MTDRYIHTKLICLCGEEVKRAKQARYCCEQCRKKYENRRRNDRYRAVYGTRGVETKEIS